jgi:hypothetical protein
VYTTAYARQRLGTEEGAFWDSLVLSKEDFGAASNFLWAQAEKTMLSTQRFLREFLTNAEIQIDAEKERAIGFLTYHMRN